MRQWIRHIGHFLVFSNIWISLCAVAFTLQTFRLLSGELLFPPLLILIFFATFSSGRGSSEQNLAIFN